MKTKVKTKIIKPIHIAPKVPAVAVSNVSNSAVAENVPVPKPQQYETDAQRAERERSAQRYIDQCERFKEPSDRRVMLRVKVRQLQDEARLIRQKENGFPRWHKLRGQLREHRTKFLRPSARHAQLALVFLRDRHTYKDVEAFSRVPPNWREVFRMVTAFGVYQTDDMSPAELRGLAMGQTRRFVEWTGAEFKSQEIAEMEDHTANFHYLPKLA